MPTRQTLSPNNPEGDNRNLEQMHGIIEELQSQVAILTAERASTAQKALPKKDAHDLKVQAPESFDGHDASKLRSFLAQVQIVFKTSPSDFPDDEKKIFYVISYLRGAAFEWVEPFIEMTDQPEWMTSYALFVTELKKVYSDSNFVERTVSQLCALQQTTTVLKYAQEFRRLSSLIHWDGPQLAHRFYEGLRYPIRLELVRHNRPRELEPLIELAIKIDDNFREFKQEQERTSKRPDTAPPKKHPHAPAATKTEAAPSTSCRPLPRLPAHDPHRVNSPSKKRTIAARTIFVCTVARRPCH